MKLQLAIIGLGQIGASLGLALADDDKLVRRIGFDEQRKVAEQARKMNAVDETTPRLEKAVEHADVVIFALPLDKIQPMLELAAPLMKNGAIFMDTAPVKSQIAAWTTELLPAECAYVGFTPVVSAEYLFSDQRGINAARADLFRGSLFAISTSPKSTSKAIKVAADIVRMIEAAPLFADLVEVDSIMTATHIIPQYLGAALLNATVDQPGWREARKLAGRFYAEATSPIAHYGTPDPVISTAILNRENNLRALGTLIASLQALREDMQNEDYTSLSERIERAYAGREQWWQDRQDANWIAEERPQVETPVARSVFSDLLRFGGKPPRRDE